MNYKAIYSHHHNHALKNNLEMEVKYVMIQCGG